MKLLTSALAERIGCDRFDLWFGDVVRFAVEGEVLTVFAPDDFSLHRIRSVFRDDLSAAGQRAFGMSVTVVFRTEVVEPASEDVATSGRCNTLGNTLSNPPSDTPGDTKLSSSRDGAAVDRATSKNGSAKSASVKIASAPNSRRRAIDTPSQPRLAPASVEMRDFVVGKCNKLAHTAGMMIAQQPGRVSPLFLYGPPGVGKTFLMESIAHLIRQHSARRRVVVAPAEQFTRHFLEALHEGGLPSFRRKYRDADVLALDDVQFFAGKRATLVELQHTVDAIVRRGGQLVLAADRPPVELAGFSSELSGRMSAGLLCPMEPADSETRAGIVEQLLAKNNVRADGEIARLIAQRVVGDARQLAGAVNRVIAMSESLAQGVTRSLAESALSDILRDTRRPVQLDDIERAVCGVFGVQAKNLKSSAKTRACAQPRMLAMWLARQHTSAPLAEISGFFGRRSHSTVLAAERNVSQWRDECRQLRLAAGECGVEDVIRRVESLMRIG